MDWNRRWAKEKNLPKIFWHKAWADNVEKIANLVWEKNTKYLTLWALSTDNLQKRDSKETQAIIKLINNIENFLDKMIKKWLKFETIWDISKLPLESQEILKKVKEKTKNNNWLVLTIALVYWWWDEIIRATKKIIKAWLKIDEITQEKFREFLDTNFLPKVDLIIRTGWDIRHSGFMLFDSEYSEYYFTQKKWPEFDKNELEKAYNFFYNSKRNFWK